MLSQSAVGFEQPFPLPRQVPLGVQYNRRILLGVQQFFFVGANVIFAVDCLGQRCCLLDVCHFDPLRLEPDLNELTIYIATRNKPRNWDL